MRVLFVFTGMAPIARRAIVRFGANSVRAFCLAENQRTAAFGWLLAIQGILRPVAFSLSSAQRSSLSTAGRD